MEAEIHRANRNVVAKPSRRTRVVDPSSSVGAAQHLDNPRRFEACEVPTAIAARPVWCAA